MLRTHISPDDALAGARGGAENIAGRQGGITSADLWAEWSAAQRRMEQADHRALLSLGIRLADALLLIGKVPARREGVFYTPDDDGPAAFLTPVLIDYPNTPETTCPAQAVRFG